MDIYLIDEKSSLSYCKKDSWILYAPKRNFSARINESAAIAVSQAIKSNNFLQEEPFSTLWPCIIEKDVAKHESQVADKFCPTQVTLFLTNKCQLRCLYCYANAGAVPVQTMTFELAKSAIDFIIDNACLVQAKAISVNYHGGGEFTSEWNLLLRVTAYAQEKARQNNLDVKFSGGTNGILSLAQLNWIATHFVHATVSIDGPPEIQDRNRPFASGRGSSGAVERTLEYWSDLGFSFTVRATITSESVTKQEEFVTYLSKFSGIKSIHFQPIFSSGRAMTLSDAIPDPYEFISNFIRADDFARSCGRSLTIAGIGNSGYRFDGQFCGVAGQNFAVTPSGHISSCYEVVDNNSEDAQFIYGHFNEQNKPPFIDEKKLDYLRNLKGHNRESCKNCFCLYTCAGWCPVKVGSSTEYESAAAGTECAIIRSLTLRKIQQSLESNSNF